MWVGTLDRIESPKQKLSKGDSWLLFLSSHSISKTIYKGCMHQHSYTLCTWGIPPYVCPWGVHPRTQARCVISRFGQRPTYYHSFLHYRSVTATRAPYQSPSIATVRWYLNSVYTFYCLYRLSTVRNLLWLHPVNFVTFWLKVEEMSRSERK